MNEIIESFEYYLEQARLLYEAPPGDLDLKPIQPKTKKIDYTLKLYNNVINGSYDLSSDIPSIEESLFFDKKMNKPNTTAAIVDQNKNIKYFYVGSNVVNSILSDILETLASKSVTLTTTGQAGVFTTNKIKQINIKNYNDKPIKILPDQTIEFRLVDDNPASGISQFEEIGNTKTFIMNIVYNLVNK